MKQQGIRIQGVKIPSPNANQVEETNQPIIAAPVVRTNQPVTRSLQSAVPTRATVPVNAVGSSPYLPSMEVQQEENFGGHTIAVEREDDIPVKKSIFSLFNFLKRKKEPVLTQAEKAGHVREFYKSLMQNRREEFHLEFLGYENDYETIYYKGFYRSGNLLFKLPMNLTASDLSTVTYDLVSEIDYSITSISNFYGAERVSFVSYEITYNHMNNDFVKKLTFDIDGIERSFVNVTSDLPFIKSVQAFLTSDLRTVEGILSGKGDIFLVDEWDLNALLKKNKGKHIKIEIVD